MRDNDRRDAAPLGAAANAQGYVIHEGCDHIFFVGFLGPGKSTIERNLGRTFPRPSV